MYIFEIVYPLTTHQLCSKHSDKTPKTTTENKFHQTQEKRRKLFLNLKTQHLSLNLKYIITDINSLFPPQKQEMQLSHTIGTYVRSIVI